MMNAKETGNVVPPGRAVDQTNSNVNVNVMCRFAYALSEISPNALGVQRFVAHRS